MEVEHWATVSGLLAFDKGAKRIALFLFLAIIGNYVTKLITGDYMWEDALHMQGFTGNALGEVIGIIIFGMIGRIEKWRK